MTTIATADEVARDLAAEHGHDLPANLNAYSMRDAQVYGAACALHAAKEAYRATVYAAGAEIIASGEADRATARQATNAINRALAAVEDAAETLASVSQ